MLDKSFFDHGMIQGRRKRLTKKVINIKTGFKNNDL